MDIDWEIIDDDQILGENLPSKSVPTKTDTELFQRPSTDINQSPSSYFPLPQADIKKPSFNDSRLLHDNGNDRQWKSVPAPTNSTRIIPVHIADENQYSSATGTESLGTKITKAATNDVRHRRTDHSSFNPVNVGTSDSETIMSSTRDEIPDDERGFYNHRNELLSIVSSRLTPTKKRSSSANSKKQSSTSSNKSKQSPLSSAKTRSKTRPIKSASSTSSLTSVQQEKKPSNPTKKSRIPSSYHLQKFDPSSIRRTTTTTTQSSHRPGPLRAHYSSDSEDYHQSRHPPASQRRKGNASISTRNEACQTINNEPTTPISTPMPPTNDIQAILNRSSSTNIVNPWPITTSYGKPIDYWPEHSAVSSGSPSKDFGIRVSDQLTALRSLLETRLIEHDQVKSPKKESSILQSSPGTFARQFLQSFRSPKSSHSISDDEDDKEVERTFPSNQRTEKFQSRSHDFISSTSNHVHPYELTKIPLPTFSPFSDELNHARMSLHSTPTSSSTIESNLAAKIDTRRFDIGCFSL